MNVKQEAALAAPPTAIVVYHYVLGLTLQDWVSVLGIVLLILQIAHRVWTWHRDAKRQLEEDEE